MEIFQVSEIENDAVTMNTKKLDECQQYDITIVPRCVRLHRNRKKKSRIKGNCT